MSVKVPKFILKIQEFFDSIHIPVLGISLWQMFQIYISGIFKGKIGRKAAAISWSFTISLFPFILFLLSVLPYMPHYDKLQFYIFDVLMHNVFPSNMEGDVRGYIENSIIPNMRGIMTARTKALTILEPVDAPVNTKAVKFEKPAPKSAVKLVSPDNLDELINLLHNEAKVI